MTTRYTESHEWVRPDAEQEIATVGISHYAQKELGEIVFVELPEVGVELKAGEEAAVLESTKSAVDIYSPVSGEVVAINEELFQHPERVNQSAEGDGWLFRIRLANIKELISLVSPQAYRRMLGEP